MAFMRVVSRVDGVKVTLSRSGEKHHKIVKRDRSRYHDMKAEKMTRDINKGHKDKYEAKPKRESWTRKEWRNHFGPPTTPPARLPRALNTTTQTPMLISTRYPPPALRPRIASLLIFQGDVW